jgi:hypothetical protein
MAGSTLDPDRIPVNDKQLGKGHGTGALGPSDTTDTGSDVTGGPGLQNQSEVGIGLDTGTTSDPEPRAPGGGAGADVGDADLSSDTDAAGTGERANAGRDFHGGDGQDIDADKIEKARDDSVPRAENQRDQTRER